MAPVTVNQPGMAGITTFWAIILARVHIHVPGGHGGPEGRDLDAANLFAPFEDEEKVTEIWVGITQGVIGGLGVSCFQPYQVPTVKLTNSNSFVQAKVEKSTTLMPLVFTRPPGSWLTFPEDQSGQCTTGVMPQ
jgi:hypothetical protein